jgi:hypothetical protein
MSLISTNEDRFMPGFYLSPSIWGVPDSIPDALESDHVASLMTWQQCLAGDLDAQRSRRG